jgi:hypothetical protein
MLTIVTGWHPKGWKEYAWRFHETFPEFWPRDVRLVTYTEAPQELGRIECRSLWDIPHAKEFIETYRDDKRANGREVMPFWKESAKARGYNFRFDCWKFSRQGFIPYDALLKCDTEFMAWFDADVITTRPVPKGFVESLMPAGNHVAYLGRVPKFSEIGFQLYRNSAEGLAVAKAVRDTYISRKVFELKEWHSAFVFDYAVRAAGVPHHNLTPGGHGAVWQMSPLAKYTDHLKGKRKHA